MNRIIYHIRVYHTLLALLSLFAYISGEWGQIHFYIGYAVALIILLRLSWALTGVNQLGLMRFYPHFEGLKLGNLMTHPAISRTFLFGIALSLILVTLTGILMDKGRSIGFSPTPVMTEVMSEDHDEHNLEFEKDENWVEEVHEVFADLMLVFVLFHVSYVLLFKFPLARFMLFLSSPRKKKQ